MPSISVSVTRADNILVDANSTVANTEAVERIWQVLKVRPTRKRCCFSHLKIRLKDNLTGSPENSKLKKVSQQRCKS